MSLGLEILAGERRNGKGRFVQFGIVRLIAGSEF